MSKFVMLALMLWSVGGCGELVDESRAVKAMSDAGYSAVRITGKHGVSPQLLGGCGKGDAVAFDVQAKNPAHQTVSVTVCCGLVVKGCTIRH